MTLVVYAAIALFIGIGLLSLIAPAVMAGLVGQGALSRDAANEVRAVYGGLNLGVAGALIATLGTPAAAGVQLAVGLMLLGMMSGRVLSALIDGPPSGRMWSYAVLEAGFGVPLVFLS